MHLLDNCPPYAPGSSLAELLPVPSALSLLLRPPLSMCTCLLTLPQGPCKNGPCPGLGSACLLLPPSHSLSSSQRLGFFNSPLSFGPSISLDYLLFSISIKIFCDISCLKKNHLFWTKCPPLAITSFLCSSLLQKFSPNCLYLVRPLPFLPFFWSSQAFARTPSPQVQRSPKTSMLLNPMVNPHRRDTRLNG